MKKIICFVFIVILFFSVNLSAFWTENTKKYSITIEYKSLLYKNMILSKKELDKTNTFKNYINKFDKVIPKLDDNKLINLYNKLGKIDTNNYKYEKYKHLLRYLYAKVWIEIYKRYNIIRWMTNNYNNKYEDTTSKTRDLDRIQNITKLSIAIEMFFQENWEYPSNIKELKEYYVPYHWDTFPIDSMNWEKNEECSYWYEYKVFNTNYWINQWYAILTCLENKKDWYNLYQKWTK